MLSGIKNLLRSEPKPEPGLRSILLFSPPYGKEPVPGGIRHQAIQSPCCGPQGCIPVAEPADSCGCACDSDCPCS